MNSGAWEFLFPIKCRSEQRNHKTHDHNYSFLGETNKSYNFISFHRRCRDTSFLFHSITHQKSVSSSSSLTDAFMKGLQFMHIIDTLPVDIRSHLSEIFKILYKNIRLLICIDRSLFRIESANKTTHKKGFERSRIFLFTEHLSIVLLFGNRFWPWSLSRIVSSTATAKLLMKWHFRNKKRPKNASHNCEIIYCAYFRSSNKYRI